MNPAEHDARADAERRGCIVGSDVDVSESILLALPPDDELSGAWLVGERPPASLLRDEGR